MSSEVCIPEQERGMNRGPSEEKPVRGDLKKIGEGGTVSWLLSSPCRGSNLLACLRLSTQRGVMQPVLTREVWALLSACFWNGVRAVFHQQARLCTPCHTCTRTRTQTRPSPHLYSSLLSPQIFPRAKFPRAPWNS